MAKTKQKKKIEKGTSGPQAVCFHLSMVLRAEGKFAFSHWYWSLPISPQRWLISAPDGTDIVYYWGIAIPQKYHIQAKQLRI
jgi:hypothetical protein